MTREQVLDCSPAWLRLCLQAAERRNAARGLLDLQVTLAAVATAFGSGKDAAAKMRKALIEALKIK